MKKAQELALSLVTDISRVEELSEKQLNKLTKKIYKLLQTYLPANISVGEVETLLVVIKHIITNPKEYTAQPELD